MTDRKRWLIDTAPSAESKRFRQETALPFSPSCGPLSTVQQGLSDSHFYAPQSFSNVSEPSLLPTTEAVQGSSLVETTANSGSDWASALPSRSKRPRCPADSLWLEHSYPCKKYEVIIPATSTNISTATPVSVRGLSAESSRLQTPSTGQTLNGDVQVYFSNHSLEPSTPVLPESPSSGTTAESLSTSLVLRRRQPHASSSALLPASVLRAIQAAYQGTPPEKVTFDVLHRIFQHFNESAITVAPNITIDPRDWEAILRQGSPTQADRVIEDLGEVDASPELETNSSLLFAEAYPPITKLLSDDATGNAYQVNDSKASAVVGPMDLD